MYIAGTPFAEQEVHLDTHLERQYVKPGVGGGRKGVFVPILSFDSPNEIQPDRAGALSREALECPSLPKPAGLTATTTVGSSVL